MRKLFYILSFITVCLITGQVLAANDYSITFDDASSEYIQSGNNPAGIDDITGDFTIEAWVKPDDLSGSHAIMYKGASADKSFGFQIDTSGKVYVDYSSDGGSTLTNFRTDNVVITADEWQHIAVAVDVSAKTADFYLNGSGVADSSAGSSAATSVGNTTGPLTIGSRYGTANYFSGQMDDVRVWSDIRTGTEISDNYQSELVGDEAGLEGYWKLNNNANDETVNSNDLTEYNTPTYTTDVPFVGEVAAVTKKYPPILMFE